jgi:hypothetical protein
MQTLFDGFSEKMPFALEKNPQIRSPSTIGSL